MKIWNQIYPPPASGAVSKLKSEAKVLDDKKEEVKDTEAKRESASVMQVATPILVLGGVALVVWIIYKKYGGGAPRQEQFQGPDENISPSPSAALAQQQAEGSTYVAVKRGTPVVAATYTTVNARDPNLAYVLVNKRTSSGANVILSFTPKQDGWFTRKILVDGKKLWAEMLLPSQLKPTPTAVAQAAAPATQLQSAFM